MCSRLRSCRPRCNHRPAGRGDGSRPRITLLVCAGIAAVFGLGLLGAALSEDDPPSERRTLAEAACQLLEDGESPDFTFRVMRDLADDLPVTYPDADLAARLAVESAQGDGCG